MTESKSILNQKVKNIMIVVELENGKSLVARPTEIGKIDELVTLKDLQRLMSNSDAPDDMKFMSPFVFALDLQDVARKWIQELEKKPEQIMKWENEHKGLEGKTDFISGSMSASLSQLIHNWKYDIVKLSKIEWIKHFFNLEESE